MNKIQINIINRMSEYFMGTPHPEDKYNDKWNYVPSNFNKIFHTLNNTDFGNLPENPKILEIGCGIGIISYIFSRYFNNPMVDGIDINDELIDVANNMFISNNINFFTKDIIGFTNDDIKKYDLIFIYRINIDEDEEIEFELNLLEKMKNNSYLYSYDSLIDELPNNCHFINDDIIYKEYDR